MPTPYFNDYKALCDYIDALPKPRPDHIRLFRGQSKDHGNLRPTGIRKPLHNDHVWRKYCGMLGADILVREGMDVQTALSRSDELAYWFYAIVQHYGPGTHLLDVSHSLEIALWFALHKANTADRFVLKYISSGLTSHGPALHRRDAWTSYHKSTKDQGVLYIFEVPEWTPPGPPGHGAVVDLMHGPEIFRRSARIQAQKACLLAAHPDQNCGDLLKLDPPPIQVQVTWPMTGCEFVEREADEIFPSPSDDEWYTRLLFLPTIHQVWNEEPYWRIAHPVELSMYVHHLESAAYAVQFKPLQPPLLYPWLVESALLRNPPPDAYEKASVFLGSTPILLEGPLFALQLEFDDSQWNHAMLARHLPRITGSLDWVGGAVSNQPAILGDVFFELSPMESVGWEDLLALGAEMFVARGVHLVLSDLFEWRLQVFFQNAPKEKIHLLFKEPAAVRFDQAAQRFQIESAEGWKDISTDPVAAKSLFVALTLLSLVAPQRSSFNTFVETANVVLKRTPDLGFGLHYYVMRHPKTNDPYTG